MGVFLKHPKVAGVIETVDINGDGGEAQALVHESRGWLRIHAAVVAAEQVVDRPVDKLDDLKVEELSDVAVQNQIAVPPKAKKDELVRLLEDAFTATPSDVAEDAQAAPDITEET